MFMTAAEIQQSHQALHGDFEGNETEAGLYRRKLREAETPHPETGKSLAESIKTEGVKSPVGLGLSSAPTYQYRSQLGFGDDVLPVNTAAKPEIVGGHHRVAVSAEHDPDRLMPVVFHHQKDVPGAWSDIAAAQAPNHPYPYNDERTDEEVRAAWRKPITLGRGVRAFRISPLGMPTSWLPKASPAPALSSLSRAIGGAGGAFGSVLGRTRTTSSKLPPPPPERMLV